MRRWKANRGGLKAPDFPDGEPNRQELIDYAATLRKALE